MNGNYTKASTIGLTIVLILKIVIGSLSGYYRRRGATARCDSSTQGNGVASHRASSTHCEQRRNENSTDGDETASDLQILRSSQSQRYQSLS